MNGRNRATRIRKQPWVLTFGFTFLVSSILLIFLFLVPLPYYVNMPGSAENLRPMVEVAQGNREKSGALMLTTVGVTKSNAINYLLALVHPYYELRPRVDVLQGQTEREYSQRLEYVMTTSQSTAIQAAYKEANIPFQIEINGVIVLNTLKDAPVDQVLLPGDRIIRMNQQDVHTRAEIDAFIQAKKPGETIFVTIIRSGVEKTQAVKLTGIVDEQSGLERTRLGISPGELTVIAPDNKDYVVSITTNDIGGPSAGLMFALEIYNQIVQENITKGYIIAGTGTITAEGKVCPIGGVQHKVIAADRKKADIFFVPKDSVPPECGYQAAIQNATDALNRAEQIKTDMTIVPVDTMNDALMYLSQLPPKAA